MSHFQHRTSFKGAVAVAQLVP